MTQLREAEDILARWRAVERALETVEPGSAVFERLASEAAQLRDAYQRHVAMTQAEDQQAELETA